MNLAPTAIDAFANRVQKRWKHLSRWARREGTDAFRVYDRDIPEVAVALDAYGPKRLLQVYLRSADAAVDTDAVHALGEAAAQATGCGVDDVVLKLRRKLDRRQTQHGAAAGDSERFVVHEGPARLLVDLGAYLDTGLFLDHRPLRRRVRESADGARVLNLFCYTGAFSVQAALGGATTTTSVDLSNTYLAWTRANLAANGLDPQRHALVRADARRYLRDAAARGERHDLIVLDPPSYSSSAKMDTVFDVQRDHAALIDATLALLAPGGTLWFSCNLKRFRLEAVVPATVAVEDMTAQTVPEDFRDAHVHRAWRFVRAAG
ncbi:MAG: class I SAM-dependent methyltransferase [Burkholderiales bacterium]|jgi:23S rRNA (cytosine1962-C5)-methyltransferase|nr:class I SAM-dependent methyltransferase [Burkholderiales bacterium]